MNSSGSYNEIELLSQLKAGSETAFRELFEKHGAALYRFSVALLKEKEAAEEVVQDTFVKLWTTRQDIDLTSSFEAFLFTIARNMTYNMIKKATADRKRFHRLGEIKEVSHNDLVNELDWRDYRHIAQEAIDALPEKRKKIFLLSTEEGLSCDEIGKELGISSSTVRNQIRSAQNDLRRYFRTNGDLSFSLFLLLWLGS